MRGGNALCAECHKDVSRAADAAKFKHRPIAQSGCIACHEPHGSAKGPQLLRSDLPELCIKCHRVDKPIFVKQHQGYAVSKARCTSCHDPHGSNVRGMLFDKVHSPVAKLMCGQCHFPPGAPEGFKTRRAGVELCKGCHTPFVSQMREKKRLHRPVAEGACLSCHGPHAAKAPGLLRDNLIKVCGACHADTLRRQELSFTKHEPVEQGACQRCHDPHSGDAPLLLLKSDPIAVCGACHDWQRHSSHPIGPTRRDPRNRNLSLDCGSCHRAHGTEYKHMMASPTTSDLCVNCHELYKR